MHTMTTDIARQLVSDRLREADAARLAKKARPRRRSWLGSAGSRTTERVVRRAERPRALFTSDIIGAH